MEARRHIVRNQRVAHVIRRHLPLNFRQADPSTGFRHIRRAGESRNHQVRERAEHRLRQRIHLIANRAEIHVQNGLLTIGALRRCGQAIDIFRRNRLQHILERQRRNVVALIHNHHAVFANPRGDLPRCSQRLHHCHVDNTAARVPPCAVLPDNLAYLLQPALFRLFRQRLVHGQKLR